MRVLTLSALLGLFGHVRGQAVTATGAVSFSATPVTTSVPSATGSSNQTVAGQGSYPSLQGWCNGGQDDVYCPGRILQDVQLSGIFSDSKTFVDKPTNGTLNATLQAYAALPANKTVQQIEAFVEQYFKGEGLELSQVPIEGFNPDPASLRNISDPLLKAWISVVHQYWSLLIRETNQTSVCPGDSGCESSLIPLNNTIVVPGGRYREIYYWDSYWILQGLLKSELYTYAWDLVSNFMDFIETYGFIPNGGRKYYLNRSQPPVFIQMVDLYVRTTSNSSILERALPLAETEMAWWKTNRTVQVTSPYTNKTYTAAHYGVNNSAPRPEGYVEDYETVQGASPALNTSQQAALYAELATGAESGWDYSSRWLSQPVANKSDNEEALRHLNGRQIIPVDLNSLMSGNHALLAYLYELQGNSSGGSTNQSVIQQHRQAAQDYADLVLDLHWDPARSWFYDYNLSSNAREKLYTPAGTFPLWQNITPPEVVNNETAALKVVSGSRYLLGKYAGVPSVASLVETGLNWDFPNTWPPHLYTSIKTFETLWRVNPNASAIGNVTIPFDSVAPGQLGLLESDLAVQPNGTIGNVSLSTDVAPTKPWPMALAIEFGNRYTQAAFCSWYSTGGEIRGVLQQLPLSDLNATGTFKQSEYGVMFEKFNVTDTDAAGGGGEYTVQIGFGWTNGVALWVTSEYGQWIPTPTCPLIPIVSVNGTVTGSNTTTTGSNTTLLVDNFAVLQGYRIRPNAK